jgi:hypothetical protein
MPDFFSPVGKPVLFLNQIHLMKGSIVIKSAAVEAAVHFACVK